MTEVSSWDGRRRALGWLATLWIGQALLALLNLTYSFAFDRLLARTSSSVTLVSTVSNLGTVVLLLGIAVLALRLGRSAAAARTRAAWRVATLFFVLQAAGWVATSFIGAGFFAFAGGRSAGFALVRGGLGTLQLVAAGSLLVCVGLGARDAGRRLPVPLTATVLLFYVVLVLRLLFAAELPSGFWFVAWSLVFALLIHLTRGEAGTSAEERGHAAGVQITAAASGLPSIGTDGEPQPVLFQASSGTPGGSFWSIAVPVMVAVPLATFFIALAAMGHDPSAGALNALGPLVAGALALGAFITTTVVMVVVRLASRNAS